MLTRVLEPEVMDTPDEAAAYDRMDHAEVNRRFVTDLLTAAASQRVDLASVEVLDLGTGTALIPIELCQRMPTTRVRAVDAAASMLELAAARVKQSGMTDRIRLERVDAKRLPYIDGQFAAVISNSIVHHLSEPAGALAEAARVTAPGGLVFFRDLLRPADRATLEQIVNTYAADADEQQRRLFADSLHAALSVAEVRELVAALAFDPQAVTQTSDRHWTWAAVN
ncbi:MAG: methyltransferase domain-containing protein [Pirellulales bacterium]|nr:methyltransferase domain-containing protein [Pirellulales bacterium]